MPLSPLPDRERSISNYFDERAFSCQVDLFFCKVLDGFSATLSQQIRTVVIRIVFFILSRNGLLYFDNFMLFKNHAYG